MAEELKACRYRVEKTGYGFWPYCVRAGDGTRELFKGHQKQCMVVAAELETAFEDGKFVAERAILPSQGGEAVEVVAYIDDGGALYTSKLLEIMSVESDGCEPLMTVAQHRRILAASVGSAEPVAYAAFADNGNIRMWCRSAIGMCELFDAHGNKAVPLYTHPADQVADDLTMVKVPRELLEQIAVELEHDNDRYLLGRELRALLAKSEGVK